MKKQSKPLTLVSIVIMLALWVFIFLVRGTDVLKGFDLFVFILIVVIGVVALVAGYKKQQEIKQGFPVDDEFSLLMKYKAGYKAFLGSMYMWLFIFIFNRYFPTVESMIGGGVLLSAVIFYVAKLKVKQEFSENKD